MYSSVPRSVNLSTTILYPGNHRVFAFLDVRRFLFESLTIKQALKEMPTFHANQKKKQKQTHTKKKKKTKKCETERRRTDGVYNCADRAGINAKKNPVSTCNKQI